VTAQLGTLITSPVLTGRSKDQGRFDSEHNKQAVVHGSDLQWVAVQLLLCSCCIVVVNVDKTGCTGFIQ